MKQKYQLYLLSILGFGIFMFSRRSEILPTIAVAIVIAPIFILRFSRIQPGKTWILLTLLGFLISMNIALWGLFDIKDNSTSALYSLIRSSVLAILYFLPFLIDRFIYPKFKSEGVLSTLSFPIISTAIFFLSSLEGPFDGTGMSGKFVDGFIFLTLKQTLSVFGVWIFVFISSWLASLINYAWEERFHWKEIRTTALLFFSALSILFVYGTLKTMSSTIMQTETVKIAAVVLIPDDGHNVSMEDFWTEKRYSGFEETLFKIENLVHSAAENNARIISFQEHAITIDKSDEEILRHEYQRIARENNVYMSITYSYYTQDTKGENKHLFIDNTGDIRLDYTKRYLLGLGKYGETGVFKKGPENILATDTPYGRIGISICRDMDFPRFIRQAGRSQVDIMFSPSYDWPKSMGPAYLFRCMENGFSLVRPTYNGFSFAADYHGKIIAHMDSDETDTGIMYAQVPIKGIQTIYPKIGDVLGWICLLGVGILVFLSFRKK